MRTRRALYAYSSCSSSAAGIAAAAAAAASAANASALFSLMQSLMLLPLQTCRLSSSYFSFFCSFLDLPAALSLSLSLSIYLCLSLSLSLPVYLSISTSISIAISLYICFFSFLSQNMAEYRVTYASHAPAHCTKIGDAQTLWGAISDAPRSVTHLQ